MLRSLQSRLFISYLLITSLMLCLMLLGLVVLLRNSPVADQVTYRRLELGVPLISRRGGGLIDSLGQGELEQAAQRLDQILGDRVLLIGRDGQPLADSRVEQPELPVRVVRQALNNDGLARGRFTDAAGTQWLYVSQAMGDGYTLIVAAERPVLRILTSLFRDDLIRPLIQAAVIALALSVVLSYLIARWIAKPLHSMAQAAKAVAEGDFEQDLKATGPREVESLALAFNEMIRQVEGTQRSQRDFVANVSHELKTPLTSIQGFAQAIVDGTADDAAAQRHAAQVIYDESDRLRRLVEELLDLARIDAGQVEFQRERIDLQAIIAGVVERLSFRAMEAGVQLDLRLPGLPATIGDGDRLAQVFTNLVDNAIKHSPQDGQVRIMGEVVQGWVTIHVEDNGPGIPPDELARIFERFYQMDKARASQGVGLGLPISHEIIRNHFGELRASSELGRGSRFSVRLPLTLPDDSTLQRRIHRA